MNAIVPFRTFRRAFSFTHCMNEAKRLYRLFSAEVQKAYNRYLNLGNEKMFRYLCAIYDGIEEEEMPWWWPWWREECVRFLWMKVILISWWGARAGIANTVGPHARTWIVNVIEVKIATHQTFRTANLYGCAVKFIYISLWVGLPLTHTKISYRAFFSPKIQSKIISNAWNKNNYTSKSWFHVQKCKNPISQPYLIRMNGNVISYVSISQIKISIF